MKLQTPPNSAAPKNNYIRILRILPCSLLCSFLFLAAHLSSNSSRLSSAHQPAPAISRPELVLQTGHAKRVDGLAFSPDGRLLASGSADNTVKLWDTDSKREVRTVTGHTSWVKTIAFRPDGQQLASGAIDGNIKLSDVASGRELRNLTGNGSVTSVAFSPDGRWLASGNMEKVIKLWDLAINLTSKQQPITLSGHGSPITTVAFSVDGKWLASGSSDKTVKIWVVETGREVVTLTGHSNRITSLAFSPDGQWLATSGFDAQIKLWKVGVWREQKLQMAAADKVLALAFDPNGHTLVSADSHKQIKLHDVPTGRALRTINNSVSDDLLEAIAMAFSTDARWLASSIGDKTIQLRDVATGRDVQTLTTHSYGVYATAFSSGGRWFATGGAESMVKLWEVATGRELLTLEPNGGRVNSLSFSPDEQLLAAGLESGKIAVWEVANGRWRPGLPGHTGSVNAVVFSPDGKWIVSGGSDHEVKVWNVANASELRPGSRHAAEVNGVAFSPDGKWIASGSADKTAKIWESVTGREVLTLTGHQDQVRAVSFSPDGRWLASSSSDRAIKIWEAATGRLAQTLLDHEAEVKTVVFSTDGRFLASGSKDNRIDLWDVTTGRLVSKLLGHTSEVYALAFTPDGRWLASASEDGSTRLWNATTGEGVATIISLRESAEGFSLPQTDWLVVSPDGLFDGSPAAWNQLLWRFDQSSLNVRPVEIFFNEFFYPGLLADILTGKQPRAPQDITQVDRRQPGVTLALVDDKSRRGESVTVRNLAIKIVVSEAPPDKDHTAGSGVRDVRLFRNGSLVKIWRGDVLTKESGNSGNVLEATVPIIAGVNQLTAYAFNRDNIKSADAVLILNGAASLARPATAYILAIGLNKYSNARWNLKYAVADAKDFGEVVSREQNLLGRFTKVEIIPLADQQATRENILHVLQRLAGIAAPASADLPAEFARLKAAEPEDAVVVFFAGHGLAYQSRFYILPHNIGYQGPRRLNQAGLERIISSSISDRDLERAFETVNAGQILFVIDACNSGMALEAEEMRRGPMNSKGLAQLAYEKGIYILAAAQSYQAAQEADELGHGLLTHALLEDGLKKAGADRAPKDGRVLLQEWLDFATERVPQFQEEKMRQARAAGKNLAFVEGEEDRELSKRNLQRPRAFYRRDLPVPVIAINQR